MRWAGTAVAVILAGVMLAGCSGPAGCKSPARLGDGSYSSYRAAGSMASGQAVRLSDGDLWSCLDGRVTVR